MAGQVRVSRKDVGRLGKFSRTGSGGIVIPAAVGRVGVLSYTQDDGSVLREYRSPEELFAPLSLQSLADITVTDDHPSDGSDVTPENYREVVVGHVRGDGRAEVKDGAGFVAADLVINDAATIAAIESGRLTEISCGYFALLDLTAGVSPEGEPYDAIQRSIVHNHVSLQPPGGGRAGPTVRLRVDSRKGAPMQKETINGKEYTVGTPEWAQAVREDAARQVGAAQADRDRAVARADGAETRVKTLEAESSPAVIEARAQARAELLAKAEPVLGSSFFLRKDSKDPVKSDDEIRRAVLAKLTPTLTLDGKSSAYIEALFDHTLDGASKLAESRKDAGDLNTVTRGPDPVIDGALGDGRSDLAVLLSLGLSR